MISCNIIACYDTIMLFVTIQSLGGQPVKYLHTLALEQKENAKHGETTFPVQRYITNLTEPGQVVTTHWHEEAEFTLITKGLCLYHIDLVDYEVQEGDLLFIPPLLLHSISAQLKEKATSETYVFHMNFLGGNSADICSIRYFKPIMDREITMPYLMKKDHPAYASLLEIFQQTHALYEEKPAGYELALKALLLQLFFVLLQYSEKNTSPDLGKTSDKLKQVLDYIELHYTESIAVSELARLCHFSDYYFMRFFKKHMNMTCVEYIVSLRLKKSVELFKEGNTSILDVSLSVGFRNLSYFHRAFKKKYHMTPLAFIKDLE